MLYIFYRFNFVKTQHYSIFDTKIFSTANFLKNSMILLHVIDRWAYSGGFFSVRGQGKHEFSLSFSIIPSALHSSSLWWKKKRNYLAEKAEAKTDFLTTLTCLSIKLWMGSFSCDSLSQGMSSTAGMLEFLWRNKWKQYIHSVYFIWRVNRLQITFKD